jgi:hypothetical protein
MPTSPMNCVCSVPVADKLSEVPPPDVAVEALTWMFLTSERVKLALK